MKTFATILLRLSALVLLATSLSACMSNNAEGLYHNPTAMSDGIYGYNAVDFEALGVEY